MASVGPRVLSTGEVRWRVQARVGHSVKQTTFLNKEGADRFSRMVDLHGWGAAMEILKARENNTPSAPSLREYTARYLDPDSGLLPGVEQGTRQGYESEAERSFLQTLGEYPIDVISRANVGAWLAWQERQPVWRDRHKPADQQKLVSSKTVRNYHALLSAIFKSAVDQGIRTDNPAFKVRVTRGTKRENVFLSPAEFNTLLYFIPDKHHAFVWFLAATGMRWGEATALTWGDVVLHGATPTARVTRAWKKSKGGPLLKYPKTSRSRRTVSLYPQIVTAMGAPGEADAFVFPNQVGGHLWHGPFNTRVWAPAVKKAMDAELCAELGLVHLKRAPTIHDLRHTHASWQIAAGMPLPFIQARLGHESITTTVNTYGHLVPDAHEQMASAIAATLSVIQPRVSITRGNELES